MAHPWPANERTGHPAKWGTAVDPYYWSDEIKPTGATSAGAWTPTNAVPAPNAAGMAGIVASPATAWTAGQKVTCQDGTSWKWSGTAWVAG